MKAFREFVAEYQKAKQESNEERQVNLAALAVVYHITAQAEKDYKAILNRPAGGAGVGAISDNIFILLDKAWLSQNFDGADVEFMKSNHDFIERVFLIGTEEALTEALDIGRKYAEILEKHPGLLKNITKQFGDEPLDDPRQKLKEDGLI